MKLNSEQQKAVNHIDGPLLVLAGAGSGKTRVVTCRIAHLIEIGILPQDILAVTFTNKAALEMRSRIETATKKHVLTCTFHSLGAKILRESIQFLGYQNNFSIYDEDDSLKLLKSIFKEQKLDEKKVKNIRYMISSYKNNVIQPDEIIPSEFSEEENLLLKVYPLYQEKLKNCNAVDFDDLLFLPVLLFKQNESIRQFYQTKWLFVLIDEYQDTNHAQYLLTKILVEKHKNLFAVGDPDQSIYSWRGAEYQNILQFDQDFPDAKIIKLQHNYRSTSTILEASNSVIKQNELRYEKNLFSTLGQGDKIGYYAADTEKEEAKFIADTILKKIESESIDYNDIAVFYRTNAQSRALEDLFLSKKIPYKIFGGLSFYQRKEIKDLIAYLKMLVSEYDLISFLRTINIPKRGIGKASIDKILTLQKEKNFSFLEICLQKNFFPERLTKAVNEYANILLFYRKQLQNNSSLTALLSDLLHSIQYLDYLKEDEKTYLERKENTQEFLSKISEWEEENPTGSLKQFLEEITLSTHQDEKAVKNSVKLMTLHHAKGLEFSCVFITGIEEELLPHINAKTPQQLEEERRLFYVGMTRAKKWLYLSHCTFRFLWKGTNFMLPSRFLKEIPSAYFQHFSEEEENSCFPSENKTGNFHIGSRVIHQTFGKGTIKKIYEGSLGETYDVQFDDQNTLRSLVAKYAKLKRFLP